MRNHRWSRTLRVAVLLLLVAGMSFAGTIQLDNNQIPPSPGTLKRLKNSRANAPTSFVQQVLANSHPVGRERNGLIRFPIPDLYRSGIGNRIAALGSGRYMNLTSPGIESVSIRP